MNVIFYNFTKRKNSTKQPTSGTTVTCRLKDDCTMLNPVLLITGNTFSYNYAYISDFGRYYWVTDVISKANSLTEIHLTCDVLASYKTAIGSTYAYIAYSSTYSDAMLIDSRLQVLPSHATFVTTKSLGIFGVDRYLMTVFNEKNTGSDAGGMGMVYYLQLANISAFKAALADNSIMSHLGSYFNGNALSGVLSLKWIPYTCAGATGVEAGGLTVGDRYINTGLDSSYMTSYYVKHGSVNITATSQYSDFRKMDPYTKGSLFLPGVGTVDINVSDYLTGNQIIVEYALEEVTGDITYMIKDFEGSIHATASANVSAALPVGQNVLNASGTVGSIGAMAGSALGLAVGAATGNPIAAGTATAGLLGSAASLALNANRQTTSIMGGIGSRGIKQFKDIIYTEYASDTMNPTVSNYTNTKGRPVCRVDRLSDHPGYIQCIDAHVSIAGFDSEREAIDSALNTGIYYE